MGEAEQELAVLRGGCTIGGERYLYLPADDALVREAVS